MDGFVMKKRIFYIGLALLLAAVLGCAGLLMQQRALADKLVRFHVVADSDSPRDQALKLAVRDALLDVLEPLSNRSETRDQMLGALQRSLPALQKAAEQTLRRLGCEDAVEISLGEERFPTRDYPTFTLPAGRYTALRVRLGSAKGHNWWCVCFPGLCSAACTDELEAIAAGAGFTEGELRFITGKEPYVLRFKVLEWLEYIRGRLGGGA